MRSTLDTSQSLTLTSAFALSIASPLMTGCLGEIAAPPEGTANEGILPTDDAAPPPECDYGAQQACKASSGIAGIQSCLPDDGGWVWGDCEVPTCNGGQEQCVAPSGSIGVAQCDDGGLTSGCGIFAGCHPGDHGTNACGAWSCGLDRGAWATPNCITPLVLAFDGESVDFTDARGDFDLVGHDTSVATRWVSPETPWLALDRNGNGAIDDGRELFGSMTALDNGKRAENGFAALAALDDDGDGRITARDAVFEHLLVWRDLDQDRRSESGELTPASELGLVAIDLRYDIRPRCDDGDCEFERARFTYRDPFGAVREGTVVDVHFAIR